MRRTHLLRTAWPNILVMVAQSATTTEARKDAAAEKRDADYAVAKEKCDALADDAKAKCIKDAKARYEQS